MRADNSHHLAAATRRRSAATCKRATAALRRLDNAGTPISFDAVAREAGVSRSWLYTQPDLRTEIEHLRGSRPAGAPRIPVRQRSSDASLRSRLELAADRARQLEADNKRLRSALAEALGERRHHDRRAGGGVDRRGLTLPLRQGVF
jgi:Family of unknown function (DUF6262)